MRTKQHYTAFCVGERVRVTDGTKRPPDAHCKKLRNWKESNFMGEVMEITKPYGALPSFPCSNPNGGLSLSDDRWPDSIVVTMVRSMSLGGHLHVERIVTLDDGKWVFADAA